MKTNDIISIMVGRIAFDVDEVMVIENDYPYPLTKAMKKFMESKSRMYTHIQTEKEKKGG